MTGRIVARICILCFWINCAEAATFTVDSATDESDLTLDGVCETFQGECTLRAAIQEANAQPGPDTITVPSGFFLLDRTGTDNVAGFGDLDVTSVVEVVGAGPALTTIESPQRAFQVRSGGDLTLRDLTLRGVDEFSESIQSGCLDVFADDASAFADNVHFESVAGQVGAFCISVSSGSFVAENSTFSITDGHTAMINAYGRGPTSITIRGSLVRQEVGAREFMRTSPLNLAVNQDLDVSIENSTFDSVSAAITGGAVLSFFCDADAVRTLTISDSSFTNLLGPGGNPRAVINITNESSSFDCDTNIVNSEFVDNDLALRVSGIDGSISQSDTVIEASTFSGNNIAISMGPSGFQQSDPRDRVTLHNVTVSGNADFGLRTFNSAFAFITNSTFTDNGTAVSNEGSNDLFLDNSVFANSSVSDCEGDFTGSFNLIEAGNCNQISGQAGTIITGSDPALGPLADNGGPTRTHALLAGSPAIDAGDDAICLAADQRGFSRPADGDGDTAATCDIGAFEKDAVLVTPPVANDDTPSTDEDTSVTIDVASNDTDIDGNLDPTSTNTACATCSTPANGSLANNADGSFDYAPDADFFGPDSFVYEICDTDAACDTATVDITVDPVNDAPSFTAGSSPTWAGGSSGPKAISNWPQNINLGPNESQAVDRYSVTTTDDPDGVLSGAAAISPAGELTYTLTGASGTAQLEATLTDDGGTANGGDDTSTPVAFTITVLEPPNVPPVANDDAPTTDEDMPVTIDVAANDIDSDGNLDPNSKNTSCGTCTTPTNGSLLNNADGTFDYTPNADFFGPDSFVYEICDTDAACDTATVNITVDPVNDAPSFTAGPSPVFASGNSGSKAIPNWPQAIDLGPDETQQVDSYTVVTTSDPGGMLSGDAAISPAGELTFTLTGVSGTAQLEATLTDDGGTANGGTDTSAPVPFTITVELPSADTSVDFVLCTDRSAPGADYAYGIRVANAGPDPAQGVAVTHTPMAGAIVSSISDPDCADTGSSVDCDLGTLAAGDERLIGVFVQAPGGGAQSLVMSVDVVASIDDPNLSDNGDSTMVEIIPGLVTASGFESCTPL